MVRELHAVYQSLRSPFTILGERVDDAVAIRRHDRFD
jgi:hypothetical protein